MGELVSMASKWDRDASRAAFKASAFPSNESFARKAFDAAFVAGAKQAEMGMPKKAPEGVAGTRLEVAAFDRGWEGMRQCIREDRRAAVRAKYKEWKRIR